MKFTPNRRGIEDVLRSAGVAELLTDTAEQVAEEIRATAPRGFMDYRESVTVEPARPGAFGDLEAAAVVDSPGWHLPEYGSVNNAPRATIRNAARAVLDTFEET